MKKMAGRTQDLADLEKLEFKDYESPEDENQSEG